MKRALGVIVVLLVASATATAEEPTAEKPAEPANKADAEKADAKKPDAKKPDAKKSDGKKGAAKKADAKKKAPPVEEEPAEDPSAEEADANMPLSREELEQSLPAHINGPKTVDVGSNIEVDVPEGMYLLERAEARRILEEGGDSGENVLAAIGSYTGNWGVIVEFADIGYVSDKDANELDPADLFRQFQDGNVQQNARRRAKGIPDLILDGWSEMPKYDVLKHHLVWGLKAHSTDGPVINFFTRILGREGFLSVNLIDDPTTIEQSKADTQGLLSAIRFKTTYRYEDHKEGDKDSGIGLKALVLGGGAIGIAKAAKAGLLIKLLLVFKKGFIFIIAGIAGFFKWIFGRKKSSDDFVPPSDDSSGDPPANV